MPKSSELDPLLPNNEPAPEIVGARYVLVGSKHNTTPKEYAILHKSEDEDDSDLTATSIPQSIKGAIFTILSFVALCVLLVASVYPPTTSPSPGPNRPIHPDPSQSIGDRVKAILSDTPLIDGHNDLAIFLRVLYKNDIRQKEFRDKFENGGMKAQVDLPRLRKGMVGGAFWSAFVVCPENASDDFSDEEYSTAVAHTLQQIDLLKRLQRQYPNEFTLAGSDLTTMLTRFQSNRTMFGPISIEGLHQIPQSAGMTTIRLYYELGVRAATLTWNCHNAFADAALITKNGSTTVAPYHRGGLTPAGRELVSEMNRLGMLVDISHTSYWTQKAVLSNATSRAPVIFTHSSAFALCPHPRNVKDDILDLVKYTDSLVMVNFSPDFISCQGDGKSMPKFYENNNTIHQVARHITYIGNKIGYDYVGLGSDFDGIGDVTPRGLDGVDKYPDLVAELLKMGVNDEDVSKIVGENILRVWRKAESVAQQMANEGVPPGEDKVSGWAKEL